MHSMEKAKLAKLSFSLSAVARLGVPPGKWFCLARTGLGYGKYSCCVCKKHSEAFLRNWHMHSETEWKPRMQHSVRQTLMDMNYDENPQGMQVMQTRIEEFVTSRGNYLVNPAFSRFAQNNSACKIITAGPRCLVDLVLPDFPAENVIADMMRVSQSVLASFSDVHIGASARDIRLPQSRAIISRTPESLGPLPPHIVVYPTLTESVIESVLDRRNLS